VWLRRIHRVDVRADVARLDSRVHPKPPADVAPEPRIVPVLAVELAGVRGFVEQRVDGGSRVGARLWHVSGLRVRGDHAVDTGAAHEHEARSEPVALDERPALLATG